MNKIRKILWFTWKDRKHPLAGGAELVNEEIAKRFVKDGGEVVFIVGGFPGAKSKETVNGYKIIRLGNKWTVYWEAYRYYKKYLVGWADLIIDEVNTIPFFAKFYVKEKNILFIHQLCREIWFYQMCFPLNLIGYLLEPIYLWLLSDRKVITVSESSKKDLLKYGFKKENIQIISEGIELEPINDLKDVIKFEKPTILALGAIKAMKRTDHVIRAFEIAKVTVSDLRLVIAGSSEGKYGAKVLKMIKVSKYKDSIEYPGKVSKEKKIELVQKAHLLCVASVKEGWGLIVTEANSQGTPAVVYSVDGLRDAVKNNETGLVCDKNTPENLAEKITQIIKDETNYISLQKNAWEWSKEISFNKSYQQFWDVLKRKLNMIFSDNTYQPGLFSNMQKLCILFATIRNPWQMLIDKLGLKDEILYKTFSGPVFYARSKTADSNEGIVVFSGKEYPSTLADIKDIGVPIILDCGGNIGTFSLYIKTLNPSAKIFTVEPFTENISLLKRNLLKNQVSDVVIIPKAISCDGKDKNFYVEGQKFDGGSLIAEKAKTGTVKIHPVESITLDEIISRNNLAHIDLLKMDIEGSEYEIIKGNRETIAGCIRRIIIEYHTDINPDGRNILVDELTRGAPFSLIYESKNILGFQNTILR